ncbi:MAG TPA: VOC family protein [Acidimicrobiales bacterium]|nr:VOC family protein [Acidimicrobiales bacterium]
MSTTSDGPEGAGGTVWSDPAAWAARRTPAGCAICRAGRPHSVLAALETCWVTGALEAPLPGYVCVVARGHHNEPFEMAPDQQARFWQEAMAVAAAVAGVVQPVKVNYEIHGNTLPHLHLHVFPRQVDDPFVGGPIDPRRSSYVRTDAELEALASAVRRLEPSPSQAGPRDALPNLRVSAVTLSTPDVSRLAGFYERLLGWDRVDDSPGWVRLRSPAGGTGLSFHHDEHFRRPVWPPVEDEQQAMAHLDIATDDLEAAVARAVDLGATTADHQPQRSVRVLLDPDGRPFCLFIGPGRGEHDSVAWHGVDADGQR